MTAEPEVRLLFDVALRRLLAVVMGCTPEFHRRAVVLSACVQETSRLQSTIAGLPQD